MYICVKADCGSHTVLPRPTGSIQLRERCGAAIDGFDLMQPLQNASCEGVFQLK